ncbi:CDP-diacylglycerol diphosphatase [Kutzneria sp. CA-103260]|uniref:CDP-diacylglycerol diphosphatase n=1 Tax=Kutzneria sp. CA-103260 TaxID=2802641 RepID=UPI001BACD272|nr:CDP-diacylglycerol diphosphatase [Kutzneria sp. CA-103260]
MTPLRRCLPPRRTKDMEKADSAGRPIIASEVIVMNGSENIGHLSRRRFFGLSSTVGVAALLVGAEADRNVATASRAPVCGDPSAATNSCPPTSLQVICGDPGDRNDPLWNDVQYCIHGVVPPPPQLPPDCVHKTAQYVVLRGKPENTHNYLLLPARRIAGIECPFIWEAGAPHYWNYAWGNAMPGGVVPVKYRSIGFGVNSQDARRFNQLHIHMAGVRDSLQRRLHELENSGDIADDPTRWADPKYRVTINGSQGDRTYRALVLAGLDQNIFTLLYRNVVQKSHLKMADQTLIVVPKKTNGGFVGTFYVLNSDKSLHGGTSTCDQLLVYS